MRAKTILIILLFTLGNSAILNATTWDEPWQDEIIRQADHFILANVQSFDEDTGLVIEVVRTIAGEPLEGTVRVSDFYLLELCSWSGGHGPEFRFGGIDQCYFFLKKNEEGHYSISTPTSGYTGIRDGEVAATYRHSYHQAAVPVEVYELTMSAIFNHYHDLPYNEDVIREFVKQYITLKPASFEETEIQTFFMQHAALETVYHLELEGYRDLIIPFLNDTANMHNQISAARALIAEDSEETVEILMEVVADTSRDNFVQVICIWTMKEFESQPNKDQLTALLQNASEESNGFGGNIMDPRVCTHFPTVKSALAEWMED